MKIIASLLILVALVFSLSVAAQDAPAPAKATIAERHRIPDGSRIYVAPIEGKLGEYLPAQMTKKKLPIVLVTNEAEADYIITGVSLKADNKWYQTVLGTAKDKNEGSIQVYRVKDRVLVWAGEAGDRSLWWGSLARHGNKKVASRLVDKMKKALFWKEKKTK